MICLLSNALRRKGVCCGRSRRCKWPPSGRLVTVCGPVYYFVTFPCQGQIALQEAVERERSIALERLKAVLHDSQAENERRLEEVNNEWKQQLQLQQSIIGKLKSQLEVRVTSRVQSTLC